MKRHREFDFIASSEGRVDAVAARETEIPRSAFSLDSVSIMINGKSAKKSAKAKAGDSIRVEYDEEVFESLEAEDIPLDVLYEDESVLVIDKAQGIAVHPGAGLYSGTVANALLARYGEDFSTSDDDTRPGIVHRLDKDTSGVMIIAKTLEAHHRLQDEFQNRRTVKEYLAIAKGFFTSVTGRIDTNIERDPKNRKRFRATEKEERGKTALTEYKVLRQADGYALLLVRIHTGRTHQIRVHLSSIGHPILGDPIYSFPDKRYPEATLMLHAYHLMIRHPMTGEMLDIKTDIPGRFGRIIGIEPSLIQEDPD